jgi:HlyD family secretion protein
MASRKKKIWLAAGVAVLLAVIVGVNVSRDSRSKVTVQTQKVGRRDLVSVVSASGEVKPKRYVNISSNVSGRIVDLRVKEGENVRKGQVLARIDSTRYEAGEKQASAGLEAARSDLKRMEADLEVTRLDQERSQRMREQQLISDQAYQQQEAEVRMKQAAVESQRRRIAQQAAVLDSDRDDLSKTIVVSPMDGVVTNLQKEEGEVVIGAQSFQPTVVMTVADLSIMEVEVLVDETDIRNLTLGQDAEVRVDALEGLKIKGHVTEIVSSAIPRGSTAATGISTTTTANQAKDFKVTVTLKDPPANLRPGLNATADITTARKSAVLAVPIQAVVVREVGPQGKVVDPNSLQASEGEPSPPPSKQKRGEEKEGVFVVKNGLAEFHPIKTGIMGDAEIEVSDGLGEGIEIVTGSYRTLRTLKDQARIKVEKKKERS